MNNKVDFFTGIAVLILSALVFISASQMVTADQGLGAGGFPKFVSVCLGALGAALSIRAMLRIKRGQKDTPKLKKEELISAGLLVVAFFLYTLLVRPLGYLIATPLFFFIFMLIYGERKWIRMTIVSVVFSVAVFFLFEKVFYILLPHGRIF